ncbi:glycoside hydrolase family 79 protein [Ceratobasidium sp. AG-Ba]|nr:glycoside hydrolase family 79 protein [Ceratobasidium sp. AG-Ba]QRW04231.1 glycoside hydrolase family 79 protein [Ceratobasidium sp. AG-Ba]
MRVLLAASAALAAAAPALGVTAHRVLDKRSVTVYNPTAPPTQTINTAAAEYTGAAAYDTTVLNPPAIPGDLNKDFGIQLPQGGMDGLSIKQKGSFMGYSIELSVADQIFGRNSSHLQVPFLNFMSTINARAGKVSIRVGGNTQETSVLIPEGFDTGYVIQKFRRPGSTPTETPLIYFSPELIYSMKNVSTLIPIEYYFGLNWIDPSNFTNSVLVAETVEAILGKDLLALQLGNEPDLYDVHEKRPQQPYTFDDYMGEFQQSITQLNAAPAFTDRQILLAPSSCCNWNEVDLFNAGFIDRFKDSLKILAVQHYPTNNCKINGNILNPQDLYPDFLNHGSGKFSAVSMTNPYRESSRIAAAAGKPFVMLETNTGSCGGFPGISDSFGAALWAADLSFQLASANLSQALFHVGGQNVYYNPFTPPPTNQSTFRQWTPGAIFYSSLLTAEAFGRSGNAQIVDLGANNGNDFTPGYAIYENGVPTKVVLLNYITDPSGNSDYTARISIGGGQGGNSATPSSVKVRRLSAASVSQKYNITWAGQTFGEQFGSDGRLRGDLVTEEIQCEAAAGSCPIVVKAPSAVLVFLNDQTLADSSPPPEGPQTFATTAATKLHNTATIDQQILATSNGRGGGKWGGGILGSTSVRSANGAWAMAVPGTVAVVGGVLGGLLVALAR